MKKRILACLLTSVMMLGAFAGCTSETTTSEAATSETSSTESSTPEAGEDTTATPQSVSLKVWTPQNQHENNTIQSQAEAFAAANPQYDIEWTFEVIGEDVVRDEIMKDVENAADVFFFANDQSIELANAGALARLGGTAEELVRSTMDESVINTVVNPENGGIYGIPFTHNTYFMYYDKTLMTEEDVKSIESILAKETGENVTNYFFESAGGWKLGAWYYGAGNTIFGESQTDFTAGADWNNETGLAVTNYLLGLKDNPKVAFDETLSVSEKITNHELGVWFDGSWNYNTYKDILGDDLGLGVIPTFNLNGEDKQLLSFYGSKAIGVNPASKNLPVAIEFATFLGTEEMQVQRYLESGQIPTNINAGQTDEVKADPVATVIINQVANASVTQPFSAEFSAAYWPNVGGIVAEMKNGELNADTAQEKLDTFVKNFDE